jgi:N-acetylmuramoyl-L-alanine amidase
MYFTGKVGAPLAISLIFKESLRVESFIETSSKESELSVKLDVSSIVFEKPLLINNPNRTISNLDVIFNFDFKLNGPPLGNGIIKIFLLFKITENYRAKKLVSTKNYAQVLKCFSMMRFVFVFIFLAPFFVCGQKMNSKKENESFNVKTIVIDAGHGGHDPGCLGSSSQEKHVCLGVAIKLGKLINNYFPKVKVIYTRDKDVFVKLHERAMIANRNKADLFISIHANSAQNKSAYGTETYVMGTKYTDRNIEMSKRENSVILLEDDHEKNYDGYDPNSPMTNILMGLYQQEYLQSSINFATKVEHQFSSRNNRHSRGVRQRVLLVMYRTTMPSVLIEVGFLTNKENEKLLKRDIGQAETAGAVFRAFVEYKREMEGVPSSEIAIEEAKVFADWDSTLVNVLGFKVNGLKTGELQKRVASSADSIQKVIEKAKVAEIKSIEKRNIDSYDVLFRVQITSSSKKIPLNSRKFKDMPNVFEYESNGMYKYAVGNCTTMEEAVKLQKKVKARVYNDAFVVAFFKGSRVSVKKAKQLIKEGKQ